ncbi:hypothetical protein [Alienimonas californiensis]|uniref:Uncharacterized protein n=1 Tax=Alienimonas californiensis TaxID=2527989 RepID=A0A517PBK0_9PLAN|nr:hypothetical protein [Alienimonas californiensis]QDT16739.1 hypothetical protein CA12_28460 [Alienimonas californiensis]
MTDTFHKDSAVHIEILPTPKRSPPAREITAEAAVPMAALAAYHGPEAVNEMGSIFAIAAEENPDSPTGVALADAIRTHGSRHWRLCRVEVNLRAYRDGMGHMLIERLGGIPLTEVTHAFDRGVFETLEDEELSAGDTPTGRRAADMSISVLDALLPAAAAEEAAEVTNGCEGSAETHRN